MAITACPTCGKSSRAGEKFCTGCGSQLPILPLLLRGRPVLRVETRFCPECDGKTVCHEYKQGWFWFLVLCTVLSCGLLAPVAVLVALIQPNTCWICTRCGNRLSRWL